MNLIPITTIRLNPKNPRVHTEAMVERLAGMIERFPKMMEIRPIVVDKSGMILGGNLRYKALLYLDKAEIPESWVKWANDLTEHEEKMFVIEDNAQLGEWDWETLEADWNAEELQDWGLDVLGDIEPLPLPDYSKKNKEVDIDEFDSAMTIVLSYEFEEYEKVRAGLSKIADNPEQAVWKLLGLDNE